MTPSSLAVLTLRMLIVGGLIARGVEGGKITETIIWGVIINWGRWKNLEKWSKFGQKLHEFNKIKAFLWWSENFFSKIVVCRGGVMID